MGRKKFRTPETIVKYKRDYYAQNKARIIAKNKEWHLKHPEKVKEMKNRWDLLNKKKIKVSRARFKADHPDAIKSSKDKYVRNNREKVRLSKERWNKLNRDYQKKYLASNPERFRLASVKRRAILKSNSTSQQLIDAGIKIEKLIGVEFRNCAYCSLQFKTREMHIEHIWPLFRGGAHSPENITMACSGCNLSKGDRLLYFEWTPPNFNCEEIH